MMLIQALLTVLSRSNNLNSNIYLMEGESILQGYKLLVIIMEKNSKSLLQLPEINYR